jgi:hypothetical protein
MDGRSTETMNSRGVPMASRQPTGTPLGRWFTEGFDTADLRDARALLDAL